MCSCVSGPCAAVLVVIREVSSDALEVLVKVFFPEVENGVNYDELHIPQWLCEGGCQKTKSYLLHMTLWVLNQCFKNKLPMTTYFVGFMLVDYVLRGFDACRLEITELSAYVATFSVPCPLRGANGYLLRGANLYGGFRLPPVPVYVTTKVAAVMELWIAVPFFVGRCCLWAPAACFSLCHKLPFGASTVWVIFLRVIGKCQVDFVQMLWHFVVLILIRSSADNVLLTQKGAMKFGEQLL